MQGLMTQQIVKKKSPKKNTVKKTVTLLSKDKKKKTSAEIAKENGKKGGRPIGVRNKPKKETRGRKPFDGVSEDVVVGKLESAFKMGTTITRACLYAGITRDMFYEFLKRKPEYSDKFKMMQENPMLVAETRLFESVNGGDQTDIHFLLKSRDPRYAPKQNIIVDEGEGVLTKEREAEIAAATDKWAGYGKEE